jgi:hypothetical protein
MSETRVRQLLITPEQFAWEQRRDKQVADEIMTGRCPFAALKPSQSMAHCPSGFPGCACADEIMCNPFLEGYSGGYSGNSSGN